MTDNANSTPPATYRHPATQTAYSPSRLDDLEDWERQLLDKVGQLRSLGKRAILLVDGSRVFVFSAEPRGTIALE